MDPDEKLADFCGLICGDYRFNSNINLHKCNSLICCSIVKAISKAYTLMKDKKEDRDDTSAKDNKEGRVLGFSRGLMSPRTTWVTADSAEELD